MNTPTPPSASTPTPARRTSTRQASLAVALRLFAERGFHGVSLADVAQALGLTKQAVLYHFKTKEALYAEVLAQVAQAHVAVLDQLELGAAAPEARLGLWLRALFDYALASPTEVRVLVRELLDNQDRTATKKRWVMREFLDACLVLMAGDPHWGKKGLDEQTAALCQWVGAISYFVIAQDTFSALWSRARVNAARRQFLDTLLLQVGAAR